MRRYEALAALAWLIVQCTACTDDDTPAADAGNMAADAAADAHAHPPDAGRMSTDASANDAAPIQCKDRDVCSIRILAASLDGAGRFEDVAELSGPGVESVVSLYATGVPV